MIASLLNTVFKNAPKHVITKDSKLILFSDCHRGSNSYADDFTHNALLYKYALHHYLENDYHYYELGDGIELWENRSFNTIFNAHKDIFLLLQKFHLKKRLHLLWGNHDMVFKKNSFVKKTLGTYTDLITSEEKKLFYDLTYDEGIVLKVADFKNNIFLIHGHQADPFNYYFWKLSRFLVRYLWMPLQVIGVRDPTSPAKNHKELLKVEKRLKNWIAKNKHMIIAGHTHRPRFPSPTEAPYFNDGSCVHPQSITGIEIVDLKITLIKWQLTSKNDGTSQIVKEIMEGPKDLALYLNQ